MWWSRSGFDFEVADHKNRPDGASTGPSWVTRNIAASIQPPLGRASPTIAGLDVVAAVDDTRLRIPYYLDPTSDSVLDMTPPIFQWVADWREDRLGIGQWMAAAIALAGAAVVYCLLSGWAAGELSRPSLSMAWAIVVGVVATATCALLRYWWHRASYPAWVRGAGCVAILAGGVAMLVGGEKLLAVIFWGRPWDGFLAHFAVRSPLALLMLAVVALPQWLQFRPRTRGGESSALLERPASTGVVLKVPTAIGERDLAAEKVLRIQAAGNYVELHTNQEVHLLRATLSSLAARLGDSGFVRVHRSTLVNCRHVNRTERDSNGEWQLRMADDTMVRVGRHYRAAAEAIIHQRRQTSATYRN